MIHKIKALIVQYWEVLSYLIFGVLTTVVNYLVYLPVYNILGLSAALSNAIAWVVAVAFAYLTNGLPRRLFPNGQILWAAGLLPVQQKP